MLNHSKWKVWGRKGTLSLLDQGAISGAHFLLNILLARFLEPSEYGIFALAYSIFLFLSGFHNSLLLEPMSVLGPANHRAHMKEYLGSLLWLHGVVSLGLSLILAAGAGFLFLSGSKNHLAIILLALGVSTPFILLRTLCRRGFYLELQPKGALRGSLIYFLLLIFGLWVLIELEIISASNAFLLMGTGSFITSLIMLHQLGPRLERISSFSNPGLKQVLKEHWHYGRWVVATTFVYCLSGNLYYFLTAGFLGLEETGAFKALHNLILPVSQVMTALGLLLLPWASQSMAHKDMKEIKRDVAKICMMMSALAGTYFITLIVLCRPAIYLLYGGKYIEFAWLLPYLAAVPLIAALGSGLQVGLKAMQTPRAIFFAYCGSAAFTISFGAGFVYLLGLKGAAIGGLFSAGIQLLVMFFCWKKILSQRERVPSI